MPRYCAASCCKNRGGQSARDQRKLSFYPFPLHDKERLEKWLRNMKRDAWTPSKHQLLCSDHFTPDSLDVRWGIRYLKQTAVPTIFSSPDDQTNMATTISPKTELEKDIPEFQVNLTQADFASSRLKVITEKDSSQHSPQIERGIKNKTNMSKEMDNVTASPEPCAPKKNIAITESLDEKAEAICPALSKPLHKKKVHCQNTENVQEDNISLNSTEHIPQTKPVLMAATVQNIEASIAHASIENPLSCTATVLHVADPEYLDSSLKFQNTVGTVADYPTEHPNSHMAGCSVEVRPSSENAVLFSTITQTMEQLNGNEESVIAIIVPAESSKESEMVNTSSVPIKQEFIDMEEIETEKSVYISNYGGTEVLQTEHSYCKQDIDRDHLWQKIAKLHSKITLLEMQEIKTLGRLRSLEALIGQLKQENLLSEEKLKIVENCFTTFEVTMIQ